MTLQEKIQNDLRKAIKNKDKIGTNNLKVIIGELQRQPKKDLTDEEVIKVIKKLNKLESENPDPDIIYAQTLEYYLPEQMTEESVKEWIIKNIDLSQFKNKMQAMKPIMKELGESADGKTVRRILESL